MFLRLLNEWGGHGKLSPREIVDKVQFFFNHHLLNRHKQTAAIPAYAESYSPDDHRFDLRPFLHPPTFESWSFKKVDERVAALERALERKQAKA